MKNNQKKDLIFFQNITKNKSITKFFVCTKIILCLFLKKEWKPLEDFMAVKKARAKTAVKKPAAKKATKKVAKKATKKVAKKATKKVAKKATKKVAKKATKKVAKKAAPKA